MLEGTYTPGTHDAQPSAACRHGAAQLRHLRRALRRRLRTVHLPAEDARVLSLGKRAAVLARAARQRVGRVAAVARTAMDGHRDRSISVVAAGARRIRSL